MNEIRWPTEKKEFRWPTETEGLYQAFKKRLMEEVVAEHGHSFTLPLLNLVERPTKEEMIK